MLAAVARSSQSCLARLPFLGLGDSCLVGPDPDLVTLTKLRFWSRKNLLYTPTFQRWRPPHKPQSRTANRFPLPSPPHPSPPFRPPPARSKQLKLLSGATSADPNPIPGYMYDEITKITFTSVSTCAELQDDLLSRLKKKSPHTKAKVSPTYCLLSPLPVAPSTVHLGASMGIYGGKA